MGSIRQRTGEMGGDQLELLDGVGGPFQGFVCLCQAEAEVVDQSPLGVGFKRFFKRLGGTSRVLQMQLRFTEIRVRPLGQFVLLVINQEHSEFNGRRAKVALQ